MNQNCLFICRSCEVNNLNGLDLYQELINSDRSLITKLNIQPSRCLWTCSRACSVTFLAPDKYTYHFVDLDPQESVAALLQFGKLYLESEDGYILPAEMPKILKSKLLVRIPPISSPIPVD